MNAPVMLMLALSLLVFLFGAIIDNSVALVTGTFLALVFACVVALLFGQLRPTYSLSGTALLILLVLGSMGSVLLLKFWYRETPRLNLLWVVVPFVPIFMKLTEQSRNWTSSTAFGVLVNNGEDNAAWLVALSQSVVNNETVLSGSSAASGGPSTGVFVAASRELFSRIDSNSVVANADNALVLLRMYALLAVLVSIVWLVTAFSMLDKLKPVVRTGFALVSAATGFAFVMGLATVGHFSAVVAVFFLSVAVFVHESMLMGCSKLEILTKRFMIFLL